MNYNTIFENTYKGKKVFLTGHTGFKGSWMLAWLQKAGAEVKGYALAPETGQELFSLIGGEGLCTSVIADILDEERLTREIMDFNPDFIFHFAAQPLVRRSYEMPLYTFEVNVNGTAHVLEAVRRLSGRCTVILVTTDKVYENRELDYAYEETDKLGGYDPYSASKAAAEIVISSYRSSFFNPEKLAVHGKAIASVRAGNVIGGGDFAADRIVPDIIRALSDNKPVLLRNPASVRPWQHVLEPLSGYLLLGARLHEEPASFAGAWNFGPFQYDVLTVEDLVKEAITCFGSGTYEVQQSDQQPHEAGLLQLNIAKAEKYLGWIPRLTAREAIRHTINWYRLSGTQSPLRLIQEQIDRYAKAQPHS